MLNIDAIQNGIVIDHITAGPSMTLYNLLGLDKLDCSVAIIRNVRSNKSGKKDIIKIEDCPADLNLDMLAYLEALPLTSEERQAIYCGNAIRLLGWPL